MKEGGGFKIECAIDRTFGHDIVFVRMVFTVIRVVSFRHGLSGQIHKNSGGEIVIVAVAV